MAAIDDIIKGFHPKPGVRYTYAAFNERGMERARSFTPPLSGRIREFNLSVTMCDVFAQRNFNRTRAQEIARWPQQIEKARGRGMTECGISLSAAFGSNWTGKFSLEQRMQMLDRMYTLWTDAGMTVKRIEFADAMSWCMPHTVERQIAAVKSDGRRSTTTSTCISTTGAAWRWPVFMPRCACSSRPTPCAWKAPSAAWPVARIAAMAALQR